MTKKCQGSQFCNISFEICLFSQIFIFLAISTPAHQDSGFLTLLQTFEYAGLELELDGSWYSVPCPKGMLVVNVGEQLSAMSNNRFKATIHRVLDIGQDRYVYLLVCHVPFLPKGAGFLLVLNILYTAVRILHPSGETAHERPTDFFFRLNTLCLGLKVCKSFILYSELRILHFRYLLQ